MQKYWTKFQWIGLCGWGRGSRDWWQRGNSFDTFPTISWATDSSRRVALWAFCFISFVFNWKICMPRIMQSIRQRKRQSEPEKVGERVGERGKAERTRARTAEWVKEQQGENKFCFGLKVCAFLSPRWHFSFLHWTHTQQTKSETSKITATKNISLSNHRNHRRSFASLLFLLLFSISFSTRVSCHASCRLAGEGWGGPPLFLAVIEQQPRNKCGELFAKE